MPFYVASQIENIYTVGLDLYIIIWDGSPLEGAIVEVEGQSEITNKEGLVTFYKLPYNTVIEIKISHPTLGEGDLSYLTISESAKGSHLYTFVYFKNPTKEHLGMQTGLTGIEWQGTIFEESLVKDIIGIQANFGIEWEEMAKPWDGLLLEGIGIQTDFDVQWTAIDIEYRQPKESVSVSVGLTSILWVEVTE